MKRRSYIIITILILFTPIAVFVFYVNKYFKIFPNDNNLSKKVELTPTINEVIKYNEVDEKTIDDDTYKVNWIITRDKKNINLYSNTTEGLTSNEAVIKNNCKYLISAGFVDTSNNHIGLFKNHKGLISKSVINNTFNGFFFIDIDSSGYISYNEPTNSLIALQTGPVLIKNNSTVNLSLTNDENARRVVAAVNRKKEPIFIVFYSKGNPLSGPRLEELPSMLEELEQNTSINITDAINLDGGSHSVFIGDQITLLELSIVGGYFCIKY